MNNRLQTLEREVQVARLKQLEQEIKEKRTRFVEVPPKDYLEVATFAHRLSQDMQELVSRMIVILEKEQA